MLGNGHRLPRMGHAPDAKLLAANLLSQQEHKRREGISNVAIWSAQLAANDREDGPCPSILAFVRGIDQQLQARGGSVKLLELLADAGASGASSRDVKDCAMTALATIIPPTVESFRSCPARTKVLALLRQVGPQLALLLLQSS